MMAAATNRRPIRRISERSAHASGKIGGAGLVQSLGRALSLLDSLAESLCLAMAPTSSDDPPIALERDVVARARDGDAAGG